ncbi:hypothetical protein F5Y04DRAFT_157168 [Hypomontagnella monticulosa]|nr:hypothetical protein F5Y04DRAFT_157168 [Hypomontagnella monticulosa]
MPSIPFPPGIAPGPVTPTRGRSIIATQTFPPGGTIAIIPDDLSVALADTPHLSQTCSSCLAVSSEVVNPLGSPGPNTPTVKVRACAGCSTAYYCSPTCQKADWKRVHGRGECKIFKRVRAAIGKEGAAPGQALTGRWNVLPTPARAALHILLRPELMAAVAETEGHVEEASKGEGRANLEFQARAVLNYMGREETQRNVQEAVEVFCKLQINSFNRVDVDIGQGGVYLNPMVAMVNHSCIPNAFVQFIGRRAVLHAYREIKEGEEIEISYIENARHRSYRQEALKTRYHFDCCCPRCKDDLDIYKVCQQYPHIDLNMLSLLPELDKLRNPPQKGVLHSNKSLQRYVEEIYPSCSVSLHGVDPAETHKQLQLRWKLCAQLREAELYAVEPLSELFVEGGLWVAGKGDYASALAISCFIELNCDAYRTPMPFAEQRVKNMLMIAKLMANTASMMDSASSKNDGSVSTRIYQALKWIDQVTLSQVAMAIAVHYCPMAHSKEWPIYYQAKDLLDDVESLPGRETENKLITAFIKNPTGPERRFFTTAVLKPIQILAGFALEVMEAEFGK